MFKLRSFVVSLVGFIALLTFATSAYAVAEEPNHPDSYYKTTNAPLLYGAVDIVIPVGTEFDSKNAMFRVFAKDFEDGDLTSGIRIENAEQVDTTKAGMYEIQYAVVDSHGNEARLTVPVQVVEDGNIKVQRKFYSNLKNTAANSVGMGRGDGHDRQHTGLSLFDGSNVKVTYIDGNAQVTIQNETQRHAGEPVTSKKISKGDSIYLTSTYKATPFVRTPTGNQLTPTILEFEILDEGSTKPLALFYEGDDQAAFIEMWRQNGGYGVLDNGSVTIMFGYHEIDNLLNPSHPNMEKDFNKALSWWNQFTAFYDEAVGLKLNPEELWDQNVKTKYYVCGHKGAGGAAYYGGSQFGISNGNTYSVLQYNWGNLHEVGHGYQGNLKIGISLSEVSNNILGWYTQYYGINTTRFGEPMKFYGGQGNGNLDQTEERVNNNRKQWKEYDLFSQLYIMVNLLDSFEGEKTWAKINSWYREHKATNMPNYDVFATVIAEKYRVNIMPYLEAFGIHVSEDVATRLYESKLPFVHMAKDVVGGATQTLKEAGVIAYDYKVVNNLALGSLALTGDLTVTVRIDDMNLLEGKTAILYDGTIEMAVGKVREGKVDFRQVPVGTYRLAMATPAAAYAHDYTYVVVKPGATVIDYVYTNIGAATNTEQYENRMWLGIRGIYETYGIKITNNGNGTATITPGGAKLANSPNGKIAEVTISNEQGEVIYTTKAENGFYFDKYAEKAFTIPVTEGYRIQIYHVTPASRVKVVSTLTGQQISELTPSEQLTVYNFTNQGFKLESMSGEEADNLIYGILKSVLVAEIDAYLEKVTPEELGDRNQNLAEKNTIIQAILSLRETDRTESYLQLYNAILNGADTVKGKEELLLETKVNELKSVYAFMEQISSMDYVRLGITHREAKYDAVLTVKENIRGALEAPDQLTKDGIFLWIYTANWYLKEIGQRYTMGAVPVKYVVEEEQPKPTEEVNTEVTEEVNTEVTEEVGTEPTEEVSTEPTEEVSTEPTEEVSTEPTGEVSTEPTEEVSTEPTEEVSTEPTEEVSTEPTEEVNTEVTEEVGTEATEG